MHSKSRRPGTGRFPLLSAMLVVVALAAPVAAQESADAEALRALALQLLNKSRAENGLPPLQIGKEINEAAKFHAADMLRRGFYGHDSPEGQSVKERYEKAGGGRFLLTAENIARCTDCKISTKTVEFLQSAWMNSKGHRENILSKGVTHFGFSVVWAPGKPLYAVQTFAGPGIQRGVAGGAALKKLSAAEIVAKALALVNQERKQAGRPALVESASLTKAVRAILPARNAVENFSIPELGKVKEALPAGERDDWTSLGMLASSCGGCGTDMTEADVRTFLRQWLDKGNNRDMVLNPRSTHLAFAIAASGQGKKVALAVVGRKEAAEPAPARASPAEPAPARPASVSNAAPAAQAQAITPPKKQ